MLKPKLLVSDDIEIIGLHRLSFRCSQPITQDNCIIPKAIIKEPDA